MKKFSTCFLLVCLSFFLYQCDNTNDMIEQQSNLENRDLTTVPTSPFAIALENQQSREKAEKLILTENDFLKTKQIMSDDAIAPYDYKTGLVGDKAYNIKVYLSALQRVKKNLSVINNLLVINVKVGKELNISEDLFEYISNVISLWNNWIQGGRFSIVKFGENYYDIKPTPQDIKTTKAYAVDLSRMSDSGCWDAVSSVIDTRPIGTYIWEHFILNFGGEISGTFYEGGKVKRYYVCDGCSTHGVSDPNCTYNYIATDVVVTDPMVYIYSLRNPSQLSIASYQLGK